MSARRAVRPVGASATEGGMHEWDAPRARRWAAVLAYLAAASCAGEDGPRSLGSGAPCAGAECNYECADSCVAVCRDASQCNARCADDCKFQCRDSADCDMSCGDRCDALCDGALSCHGSCERDCRYTCTAVESCRLALGPGSLARCESVDECEIRCSGSCRVECVAVEGCYVYCAGGEPPLECGHGVKVCDRPCSS